MILAVDTSTQWMGIALFDGNSILYEKIWKTSRRHTIELTPAIESAFQDCDTSPDALDAVAIAIGPGSFTSLRIGLAVAKGLALSKHIPIIGVPSLEITARGVPLQDCALICVLRAGRGRLGGNEFGPLVSACRVCLSCRSCALPDSRVGTDRLAGGGRAADSRIRTFHPATL